MTDQTNAGVAEALTKALTAGYGSDVAGLTGGGALRFQSIDPVMQAILAEQKHFVLWNKLARRKVTATVDEWTENTDVGGFLGGNAIGEISTIPTATGTYKRRVGTVKYLMTRRRVSVMQAHQNTLVDSIAVEQQAAAIELLRSAENLMFEGDEAVVPTQFSGIKAQLLAGVAAGEVQSGNVIDNGAQPLNSIDRIAEAAATLSGLDSFGTPTDILWPVSVQTDMDNGLNPAFRVPLTSVGDPGVQVGAPVVGVRTSAGPIATTTDVFITTSTERQPWDVIRAGRAAANVARKPQSAAGAAATDASSKFAAGHAGNYYYAVAGVDADGQSGVLVTAQVAVAAGDRVTLTIGASAAQGETGYVIYRSRKNGGNAIAGSIAGQGSDFREIGRVARNGASTTFYDLNESVPGTTEAYVLNLSAAAHAITWGEFMPMTSTPLAMVDSLVTSWAQFLAGYLRISKRQHHAIIRNILPSAATWKPFG